MAAPSGQSSTAVLQLDYTSCRLVGVSRYSAAAARIRMGPG